MPDRSKLQSLLVAECIGLGPIEELLDDPEIFEIFVHRFDQVFIRKSGHLIRYKYCFASPLFLESAAARLAGNASDGPLQNMRFENGTKVVLSLPPLTKNPVLTIEKPRNIELSFDELIASNIISASAATFLRNAVASGRSILIAGPRRSGRSTMVSSLASEIRSGERLAIIEDSPNLKIPPFAIPFEDNPGTAFNAVKAALQTHPNRILLDPCTPKNAYHWINAIACGVSGSIGTIFGTTTLDAMGRMESMALLGENTLSPRGMREQIARAIDLVVVLYRAADGFHVQQISEVTGVDFDSYRTQDIFSYRAEGRGGRLHATGYIPPFYEDLKHSGFEIDFNIFRE